MATMNPTPVIALDNSGHGPLRVPGFSGVPLEYELEMDNCFAPGLVYPFAAWTQARWLTLRELAMLQLMDELTDEPDWHLKMFEEDTMDRWAEIASRRELISTMAWHWCVDELEDKARLFEKSQRTLVYNTAAGLCKSDTLVSPTLRDELRKSAESLLPQGNSEEDWQPYSHQQVLNLVDPSLFPLIYGRTPVLADGGRVDLESYTSSYGRGKKAPSYQQPHIPWQPRDFDLDRRIAQFQWLPCEVEFSESSGTNVRITSYINNLHPVRHKDLYHIIEKLISVAILPWNDVLIKGRAGRTPMRIKTFGTEWVNHYPQWAQDHHLKVKNMSEEEYIRNMSEEEYIEVRRRTDDYLTIPDADPTTRWFQGDEMTPGEIPEPCEGRWNIWDVLDHKYRRVCHWVHPEPGDSFTYNDWKAGRTKNAIIKRRQPSGPQQPQDLAESDHEFYEVAIQDSFRQRGLQVIVRLASIELTSEKPSYDGGRWHEYEGLLNEHIAATAVYYYDVENVTDVRLAFRQQAYFSGHEFQLRGERRALAGTFGLKRFQLNGVASIVPGQTQLLGSVAMPQGRLLAFPSTVHSCIKPFSLLDKARSGHCRFILLSLVDPHYRVCSTRNVPPQQHSWWADAVLADGALASFVPPELQAMILEYASQWTMNLEQAKEIRVSLREQHREGLEATHAADGYSGLESDW